LKDKTEEVKVEEKAQSLIQGAKNETMIETSIGTKKVAEEEGEEKHVHHYVWKPASIEDYYHIRDGHKFSDE
jgi:hypothetical protein